MNAAGLSSSTVRLVRNVCSGPGSRWGCLSSSGRSAPSSQTIDAVSLVLAGAGARDVERPRADAGGKRTALQPSRERLEVRVLARPELVRVVDGQRRFGA